MDRTPLPSKLLSVLLAVVLSLSGFDPFACGELSLRAAGVPSAFAEDGAPADAPAPEDGAPAAPAPASPYGDPAEVRLDRGDVVLGAEGVSGLDGEGAPVQAATHAVVVGQADDGAPCSHVVSVGAGSWRIVLDGVRFEGASTFMDMDAAAIGGGWARVHGVDSAGVPVTISGGAVKAQPGAPCTHGIGNGADSELDPVWPTDGSSRVHPYRIAHVDDPATLSVDGRSAAELGIAACNDDGGVHLYLTAGTHALAYDGRSETVSVGEGVDERPLLKLRIVDGSDASDLEGACVEVRDAATGEVVAREASAPARLDVPLGAGRYVVKVRKGGYRSRTAQVAMGAQDRELTVPLNSEGTISGQLTATEMSRDEIVEAGIDPDAPGNEHVFNYKVVLEFAVGGEASPVRVPLDLHGNGAGLIDPRPASASAAGGFKVEVHPLSERFFLVIYGNAHWLKEMFDVELVALNGSAVESVSGLEATLDLPEGLSLADMAQGAQSATVPLGEVAPGGTARAHWYVRGDAAGSYSLSARISGSLTSPGVDPQPFSEEFRTSSPLEVLAGSAMHLHITVEDRTWFGDDYHVGFRLENVSGRPVNNLSLTLTGEEQYRVLRTAEGEEKEVLKEAAIAGESVSVDELAPGESLELRFSTIALFESPHGVDPEFVLVDRFLEMLDGSTAEIPHSFTVVRGERTFPLARSFPSSAYPELAASSTADPVSLLTGGFTWSYTDLSLAGARGPSYTRCYDSTAAGRAGRLGPGWSDGFSYRVDEGPFFAEVSLPAFEEVRFEKRADGSLRAPDGCAWSLERAGGGWRLSSRDGTVCTFDGPLIASIERRGAERLSFSHVHGRLASVSGEAGALYFSYDEAGLLEAVTDSTGRRASFGYEGGRLASARNADGDSMGFSYDEAGLLAEVGNLNGEPLVRNSYDGRGRVSSQTVPGRGSFAFSYDDERRTNTCAGDDGSLDSATYDERGRLVASVRGGVATAWTYDERNLVTSEEDGAGGRTLYDHDEAGDLVGVRYADGTSESFFWDAEHRLVTATDPAGAETRYSWDAAGDLVGLVDPRGGETRLTWDANHRVTGVTDPLGNGASFSYDARGNRASAVDPLGREARYSYDAAGRLAGRTDANGNAESYVRDALGSIVETVDAAGNSSAFSYDARGNLVGESLHRVDAPDGVDEWDETLYVRDARGLLASRTDPLGNETSYRWDGNGALASTVDAEGRRSERAYDARGLLASLDYGQGASASFSWDAAGRLAGVSDWAGETSFERDALGRIVAVATPSGRSVGYAWDALGRRTETVYPDGARALFSYDASGRTVSVGVPGGGDGLLLLRRRGPPRLRRDARRLGRGVLLRPLRAALGDGAHRRRGRAHGELLGLRRVRQPALGRGGRRGAAGGRAVGGVLLRRAEQARLRVPRQRRDLLGLRLPGQPHLRARRGRARGRLPPRRGRPPRPRLRRRVGGRRGPLLGPRGQPRERRVPPRPRRRRAAGLRRALLRPRRAPGRRPVGGRGGALPLGRAGQPGRARGPRARPRLRRGPRRGAAGLLRPRRRGGAPVRPARARVGFVRGARRADRPRRPPRLGPPGGLPGRLGRRGGLLRPLGRGALRLRRARPGRGRRPRLRRLPA